MTEPVAELTEITLSEVRPDPRNANVMDTASYLKARQHISQTGQYPPLIVRELPKSSVFYDKGKGAPKVQLMYLDGHHRSRMLSDLGHEQAQAANWGEVPDDLAGMYLATLNYNVGKPDSMRLGELLQDISATISLENIAAVVPYEVAEIESLMELQQESFTVSGILAGSPLIENDEADAAIYRRFTIYPLQDRTISMALSHLMRDMEGQNKEGRALEALCISYLSGVEPQEYSMLEAEYLQSLTTAREPDPLDNAGMEENDD